MECEVVAGSSTGGASGTRRRRKRWGGGWSRFAALSFRVAAKRDVAPNWDGQRPFTRCEWRSIVVTQHRFRDRRSRLYAASLAAFELCGIAWFAIWTFF